MDEVVTVGDGGASSKASSEPSSILPYNLPLISAFLAFAIAQFLKLFTTCHRCCNSNSAPSFFFASSLQFVHNLHIAFNPQIAVSSFKKLRYKEKRWDSKRVIDSGGMPSSHSATVMALAVAIGFQDGTGDPAFAIAVVLACVVMYDASGIRHHAGRQAELLNQIVCEFPPEHPLAAVRPLRELLGHTPLQVVAGAVLGCIVGYLMRNSN